MNDQQGTASRKRMLWALSFGGFLVNADNRAITPMLPAIAVALGTSVSSAALLVTAYSIPYGLCQLIYGPIADRIGKIRTIFLAACLFAAGTVACGLVHTYASLLVLRIVTGMFAAGIIPTTLAQIGDRFALAERPGAIAFFMSMSTSGQAMGIVIGGLVAQWASYRVLFILLGLLAIPTLAGVASQRDDSPRRGEQALSLGARYAALARSRRAWFIYGTVLCEGFVFYGGFTFLGAYGVADLHLTYFVIGLLTATYSLGAFVGSRTITRVIGRVGGHRMPVIGSLLMAAGFALVWLWASVPALTLGFLLLGYGFSYCHSTLQTFATELLPGGRATAISVFAFSLFLGSGVGPMAFGPIFDQRGAGTMLETAAAAMLIFALWCTLFTKVRPVHVAASTPAPSQST